MIARTWVDGEVGSAAKLNTIRDDLLELDAVAGFLDAQFGTITISPGASTADATVAAMSARAMPLPLGFTSNGNSTEYPTTVPRLSKVNATTVRATRTGTSATTVMGFMISDPRG